MTISKLVEFSKKFRKNLSIEEMVGELKVTKDFSAFEELAQGLDKFHSQMTGQEKNVLDLTGRSIEVLMFDVEYMTKRIRIAISAAEFQDDIDTHFDAKLCIEFAEVEARMHLLSSYIFRFIEARESNW